MTLPSQVTVCSCFSSGSSIDASRPALSRRGARLDASEASAVAASGDSGVMWIATLSVSSSVCAISSRRSPSGGNQSGTIAITWPPASIPDFSASTSSPTCSCVGASGTASIRPSAPTIRSGRRPNATITGTSGLSPSGRKLDECSSPLAGTEAQ